jgi:hypothetical protein
MIPVAELVLDVLSDESKWAKGALSRQVLTGGGDVQVSMCLMGAYGLVVHGDAWYYMRNLGEGEYLACLARIMTEQFPGRFPEPYQWNNAEPGTVITVFNDHPETTFPDIRLVLEKAAAG